MIGRSTKYKLLSTEYRVQSIGKKSSGKFFFFVLCTLYFVLCTLSSFGHTVNYDDQTLSATAVSGYYLKLGFTHILPFGFDHILFILGIFFLTPNIRSVLLQATAFTVAHSITLGLAASGTIHPLPGIVEPIIALSIAFVCIENIFLASLKWWRILIVFCFGLIHGMGFAGVLAEIGLPETSFLNAIISFNVGVELGQITVILLANYFIVNWIKKETWYRNRFVIPVSACIAVFAFWLTFERMTTF